MNKLSTGEFFIDCEDREAEMAVDKDLSEDIRIWGVVPNQFKLGVKENCTIDFTNTF